MCVVFLFLALEELSISALKSLSRKGDGFRVLMYACLYTILIYILIVSIENTNMMNGEKVGRKKIFNGRFEMFRFVVAMNNDIKSFKASKTKATNK